MTNPVTDPAPDLTHPADHGGGIDAAVMIFGGPRGNWIDLSTGINPQPYPIPELYPRDWTDLPDSGVSKTLELAARRFWRIPDDAAVLAAPGASSLIARIPAVRPPRRVNIPGPTYNEHARAFTAEGWQIANAPAEAQVLVHPNNPDGRLWSASGINTPLTIIDESFCDVMPEASLMPLATRPGTVILKSFGKFWGLAGLRLGFAIGDPKLIVRLSQMLGPWPVSGAALHIGTRALLDTRWADDTRVRLAADAARLDDLITAQRATLIGGTSLFRLYEVPNAGAWQDHLARRHIWTRIFPYNPRWIRFGLPGTPDHWARLTVALKDAG